MTCVRPGGRCGRRRSLANMYLEEFTLNLRTVRGLTAAGKIILSVALIGVSLLVTQHLVAAFHNPRQMDIVRSMVMEMKPQMPSGAAPVHTAVAKKARFAEQLTYLGTADAFNDVPIYARTPGWVRNLKVYAGDSVRAGQTLAVLDSSELSSRAAAAAAGAAASGRNVEAARAARDEARAHVGHFDSLIEQAKSKFDYWKSDIVREERLLKDQVISLDEFQRTKSEYESSKAAYEQALSEKHAAQKSFDIAQTRINEAVEQRNQASAQSATESIIRGYTVISSPVSGVVTSRAVDLGTLVNPQVEMLRVAQIDPIRIQAQVPLADLPSIRKGMSAKVNSAAAPDTAFSGIVTSIFPQSDIQTRTSTVEVLVKNPRALIRPGDFVTVSFTAKSFAEAVILPSKAVFDRNQYKAVWIVEDKHAKLRYVTVGSNDQINTRIVSGLKAGERIIVEGRMDLQEGDAVVDAAYKGSNLVDLPRPAVSNKLSGDNHYVVEQVAGRYAIKVSSRARRIVVGPNELTIEATGLPGSLPAGTELKANWLMLSMPAMRVPQPLVRRISDGRYAVTVDATMNGTWKFDLQLTRGSEILGTSTVTMEAE